MKRSIGFLALILCLAMVFAIFAGCGGEKSGGSSEASAAPATQKPAPTEAPEPEPEEPVTGPGSITYPIETDVEELTMWLALPPFIYNNVDVTDYGSSALPFQLAEAATGIHIAATALPTSTAPQQYNILVSAGDYCDIMSESNSYAGGADAAVADGVLLELSPYLEEFAPDYYAEIMADPDYAKYVTTDEGNVVDLIGRSAPAAGLGAVARADWLRELGMDTPVTYEDYYEAIKAFKVEFNAEQPIAFLAAGIPYGNSLTSGYGIDAYINNMGTHFEESFYVVDGQVKFGLAEDGFKEYLLMANQWYEEGLINPNFLTYATTMNPDITASIAAGTAGVWYGGDDYFADDYKLLVADPNYEAVGLPDPVKKEGDILHTGDNSMTRGRPSGMKVAISALSEHPDVALMYINFFFTEAGIIIANYGEENNTFEYAADGSVVITDVIAKPANNLTVFAAKAIYTSTMMPFYEIPGRWSSLMNEAQIGLREVWTANRDTAWLYYGSLTAQEGADFNVLFADVNTLALESVAKFITGEMDIEAEFGTFVENMYGNGLQICIDYKQAAYERYLNR